MDKRNAKDWWRARQADVGVLAAIVLAFCAAFGWALFRGRLLLGGDSFVYCYPLRTVAWRMLRAGQLPLWTPYIMSGYPLLSMAQLGLGYPLTWGYLFLHGHIAEQIYVLAPFVLAPLFTYAYVRELGLSRLAALLAGLSFGYGGSMTNLLGLIGMPNNAEMWLPLLLIFVERTRRRRLAECLLGAAIVYAFSVLTGYGQGFMRIAIIAVAYAVVMSLSRVLAKRSSLSRSRFSFEDWRPVAVTLGAIALGAGVAAFQILETMRAVRRSIRSTLNMIEFTAGYFPVAIALKSFIAPLYTVRFADVTTFVAPVAVALAIVACAGAFSSKHRAERRVIWFWSSVALVAAILIVGPVTPLYPLLFHVPVFNLFRVPSRYAFEWSFALSILAAYGWDFFGEWITRQSARAAATSRRRELIVSGSLVLVMTIGGFLWWRATTRAQIKPEGLDLWYSGLAPSTYLAWKIALVLITLIALWQAWRIREQRWRVRVLAAIVMLGCMIEPCILIRNWWQGFAKTSVRLTTAAPLTRYLQQFNPEDNRVYTRLNLFTDENSASPRVDPLDLTAMYGLHNVAGYEPLMLDRYSRALGHVSLDSVNPLPGYPPKDTLLGRESHVLDLLNTRYVASFSNLRTNRAPFFERAGVKLDLTEAGKEISPGKSEPIAITDALADSIALVTSLANSADVVQGTAVARVRLVTTDGQQLERDLRAGEETAEWAHERPDVRATVKHKLATVFDRQMGDLDNTYQACRYFARIDLGARVRVKRVEIVNLSDHVTLALWATSLWDSATGQSEPLSRKLLYVQLDEARWRREPGPDDLLILRNERALPRAWLVTEAEGVDGEEALRRIEGESAKQFDPRRTALLEVAPAELPKLPGGEIAPDNSVRIIRYEPNRLQLDTKAATPAVLIVSEMFYPGWEATVDEQPAKILLTDYLLRGVALPAGQHRVEMRYRAPAARNGAVISGLALLSLLAIGIYARRTRRT